MADGTAPSSAHKGRRNKKRRHPAPERTRSRHGPLYGALDLGTNNCRLLVATPTKTGFKVIDSYSQIVRLGEGLDASGALGDAAMDRAMEALHICATKIKRHRVKRVRCVATQACRTAINGKGFLDRVREETSLRLQTITPEQEARLAVRGCEDLLDTNCAAALVIDIGGGSTELSWVDFRTELNENNQRHQIKASTSLPMGVVNMAERFPEKEGEDRRAWFADMRRFARNQVSAFKGAEDFAHLFDQGNVHFIGTSGAVTSLGGVHLNLPRYLRSKVDGIWLSRRDAEGAIARLLSQSLRERAQEPCIGEDRADLVLAGCAILAAIQDVWPAPRIRVADRGLREGLLLGMMGADQRRARRKAQGHKYASAKGEHHGG
ncbi:MAG: exopolyphosphatase [Robiginitomaculum sp.]|nr:MAG: exopolyphosphatase [Robiginitomaculum sp.]